MLFVADSNRVGATPIDNRVLMFDTNQVPAPHADLTTLTPFNAFNCNLCAFPALNVLGEPDYVTTTPGRSQSGAANSDGGCDRRPYPGGGGYRQQPRADLDFHSYQRRSAGEYRAGAGEFHSRRHIFTAEREFHARSPGCLDSEWQIFRGGYAGLSRLDLEQHSNHE